MISYLVLFYLQNFKDSSLSYAENWKNIDHEVKCYESAIPCFMFYSGFDTSYGLHFTLNLLLFMITGVFACTYKFIKFDYEDFKYYIMQRDKKYSISRMLFNFYDWSQSKKCSTHSSTNLIKSINFEISWKLID